jgi:DNA-binding transcriptional LysR family regulator
MEQANPCWELYRSFLEVMRDGSLSGAARRLGLSQPTLGRHIDALEQGLGGALFTRSQRGLQPVELAHRLLPHAEAMASAQAALLRAASGEDGALSGTVRVTASEVMGCEVLPTILAGLCHEHPAIELELVVSNRNQDLLRRDADIAVRMLRPTQEAVMAMKLGAVEIGLFAHPDYLARCGTPATLEDLRQHRLIGFDRDDISFRSVGGSATILSRADFGFRCDNDVAQLAALRAGLGIGGCQVLLAQRAPPLVRLVPVAIALRLEVWLAMHERLASTRRVRAVYDHLAARLRLYLAGKLFPSR